MNQTSGGENQTHEDPFLNSDELLGILRRARHLLDWEGAEIVPAGPEEALIDYLAAHKDMAGPLTLALLYNFRLIYGAGVARVRGQIERYTRSVEQFVAHYGPGPLALGRAPARINILGEHVDYVRYMPTEVLPFASREHDMLMLFRTRRDTTVRGATTLHGHPPGAFSLAESPPRDPADARPLAEQWLSFLQKTGTPERHWLNYTKAAAFYCALKHPHVRHGFDFLLDSALPAAGGASSSSAIVVLAGAAVRIANQIPLDPETLAQDSSRAEWYIGTRGGNMDHCTMCLSRRQSALHLNFSPFATELVPLHRYRYRWLAFFSHPADKSGDVLLKFNERSAVSRLLIPALLDELCRREPAHHARWQRIRQRLTADKRDIEAGREAAELLEKLPQTVTLAEIRQRFPEAYLELEHAYPALAEAMAAHPIKIRPRALHHAGEIVRVREAVRILREVFDSRLPEEPQKTEPALRSVGDLLTESHESLRDLYEITTPDIDQLIDVVLSHRGVYGARLMGGGFGGNVLALVNKESVAELVDRVQERYYKPRRRDGLAEGSVTVSTPGEAMGLLSLHRVVRQGLINASAVWWKWPLYGPVVEAAACELLRIADIAQFKPQRPVQPIIVAGAHTAGSHKPDEIPGSLRILDGKTSLERVLHTIAALPFPTRPPIVIVSPAMARGQLKKLALPENTRLVSQARPLGTGHAILAALDQIAASPEADILVAWGSQPLLTTQTLLLSIAIHQALGSSAMLFPTAVTRTPYAPIQRDLHGYVIASRETAAEGAPTKRLGETNVGAFLLSANTLCETLRSLHRNLWDQAAGRYRTTSGQLGFPNHMARALVRNGKAVIALPIAEVEESLGLRNRADYEQVRRLLAAPPAPRPSP